MTRVASIVINSVTRDARVVKEGRTLAEQGYDVTIFGIQDNNDSEPSTELGPRLRIVRVDWKAQAYRLTGRTASLAATVISLGILVPLWVFTDAIVAFANQVLTPAVVVRGLATIAAAALFIVVRGVAKNYRAAARRLGGPGPGDQRQSKAARRGPALRRRATLFLVRRAGRIIRDGLLRDELIALRPAVIHCHDLITVPIGVAAARRIGAKVVFDSHEIFEEVSQISRLRKLRFRMMQRRISGKVDGFITVNDSIAEFLRTRYPRLPPAVVVCNAVPLDPEGPPADDGRLRDAASVESGRKILLYQGGFARHRGLDILVRSAPMLPDDWCLVMMGWGTYQPTLERIADEVDIPRRNVRFIPGVPQDELRRWTAGADLGVIPYENVCLNHWYCSPNKLWEYPAAGVPLLVSPFPVLVATIEQHRIGWALPEPLAPTQIADTVAHISDTDLAAASSRCGTFIRGDNWATYSRRLVDLYAELTPPPTNGPTGRAAGGTETASTASDSAPGYHVQRQALSTDHPHPSIDASG